MDFDRMEFEKQWHHLKRKTSIFVSFRRVYCDGWLLLYYLFRSIIIPLQPNGEEQARDW